MLNNNLTVACFLAKFGVIFFRKQETVIIESNVLTLRLLCSDLPEILYHNYFNFFFLELNGAFFATKILSNFYNLLILRGFRRFLIFSIFRSLLKSRHSVLFWMLFHFYDIIKIYLFPILTESPSWCCFLSSSPLVPPLPSLLFLLSSYFALYFCIHINNYCQNNRNNNKGNHKLFKRIHCFCFLLFPSSYGIYIKRFVFLRYALLLS